jgi:hypothetical protein
MHAEIAKYFGIYLDGENRPKSDWPKILQQAAWAYNSAYHMALRRSPYEALTGEKPPMGALGIPQQTTEHDSFEKYYGMRRSQLIRNYKAVQDSLRKNQDSMIRYQNRSARPVPFKVGDYVWYKNNNPSSKWEARFYGPWRIVDQLSPVLFDLDLEGHRFIAHATQLKIYKGPLNDSSLPSREPNLLREEEGEDIEEEGIWFQPFNEEAGPRFTPPINVASPELHETPTAPVRGGVWRKPLTYFRKAFDRGARQLTRSVNLPIRSPVVPVLMPEETLLRMARNPFPAPAASTADQSDEAAHSPPPSSQQIDLSTPLRRSERERKAVQRLNL